MSNSDQHNPDYLLVPADAGSGKPLSILNRRRGARATGVQTSSFTSDSNSFIDADLRDLHFTSNSSSLEKNLNQNVVTLNPTAPLFSPASGILNKTHGKNSSNHGHSKPLTHPKKTRTEKSAQPQQREHEQLSQPQPQPQPPSQVQVGKTKQNNRTFIPPTTTTSLSHDASSSAVSKNQRKNKKQNVGSELASSSATQSMTTSSAATDENLTGKLAGKATGKTAGRKLIGKSAENADVFRPDTRPKAKKTNWKGTNAQHLSTTQSSENTGEDNRRTAHRFEPRFGSSMPRFHSRTSDNTSVPESNEPSFLDEAALAAFELSRSDNVARFTRDRGFRNIQRSIVDTDVSSVNPSMEAMTTKKRGKNKEKKQNDPTNDTAQSSAAVEALLNHGGLHSTSVELIKAIASGIFICVICMDTVRKHEQIWSCGQCRKVLHFSCAKEWALSHEDRTFGGIGSQHPGNLAASSENDGTTLSSSSSSSSSASTSVLGFRDRTSKVDWPCPLCNNMCEGIPTIPTCYCGQSIRPSYSRLLLPHSCFNSCDKPLSVDSSRCPHNCSLACHPGPCPPCSAVALPVACWCGSESVSLRCGDPALSSSLNVNTTDVLSPKVHTAVSCTTTTISAIRALPNASIEARSCHKPCGKTFLSPFRSSPSSSEGCGKHFCTTVCHPGECGECPFTESLSCFCGAQQEVSKPCGFTKREGVIDTYTGINTDIKTSTSSTTPKFRCGGVCGKMLACGNHSCTRLCHEGPCGECPRLPVVDSATNIPRCACGKSHSLSTPSADIIVHLRSEPPRISCLDPLPSCGVACGRLLNCSTHRCERICHDGPCLPCTSLEISACRCAKTKKCIIPCQLQVAARDVLTQTLALPDSQLSSLRSVILRVTPVIEESNATTGAAIKVQYTGEVLLAAKTTTGISTGNAISATRQGERDEAERDLGHLSSRCLPLYADDVIILKKMSPVIFEDTKGEYAAALGTNPLRKIPLTFTLELGGPVMLCGRQCNALLNCAKHHCSNRCCPDASGSPYRGLYSAPHNCAQQTCGAPRPCGHACSRPCHPGPCLPCSFTYQNGVSCPCGRTTLPPRTKCAPLLHEKLVQSCLHKCNVVLPCGHRCTSACHPGPHPPCGALTNKPCVGGHGKIFQSVPCRLTEVRCSLVCNKTLPCGRHSCDETCHAGPCPSAVVTQTSAHTIHTSTPSSPSRSSITSLHSMTSNNQLDDDEDNHNTLVDTTYGTHDNSYNNDVPCCGKTCGRTRAFCGHICSLPCHTPLQIPGQEHESDPDDLDAPSLVCGPCDSEVESSCMCGGIHKLVKCGISGANGARITEAIDVILNREREKYIIHRCEELAAEQTLASVSKYLTKLRLSLSRVEKEAPVLMAVAVSALSSSIPLVAAYVTINDDREKDDLPVQFHITITRDTHPEIVQFAQSFPTVAQDYAIHRAFPPSAAPFTLSTSPALVSAVDAVTTCMENAESIIRFTNTLSSKLASVGLVNTFATQQHINRLVAIATTLRGFANDLSQVVVTPPASCVVTADDIRTKHNFASDTMKVNVPRLLLEYARENTGFDSDSASTSRVSLSEDEIPESLRFISCDSEICKTRAQNEKIRTAGYFAHIRSQIAGMMYGLPWVGLDSIDDDLDRTDSASSYSTTLDDTKVSYLTTFCLPSTPLLYSITIGQENPQGLASINSLEGGSGAAKSGLGFGSSNTHGGHILRSLQAEFKYTAEQIANMAAIHSLSAVHLVERQILEFCRGYEASTVLGYMPPKTRLLCHAIADIYGLTSSSCMKQDNGDKRVKLERTLRMIIPPIPVFKAVETLTKYSKLELRDSKHVSIYVWGDKSKGKMLSNKSNSSLVALLASNAASTGGKNKTSVDTSTV